MTMTMTNDDDDDEHEHEQAGGAKCQYRKVPCDFLSRSDTMAVGRVTC